MKNKIIKIINISLLLLCMISIFLFSSQDRDTSTNTSVETTKVIVTSVKVDEEKADYIADNYFRVIRKSAHIIEFFCLGVLVINVIKDYKSINYKWLLLGLLFCMLYAISDEIHQLYVPGRSCEFKDMLIDTIGSGIGIIIYYLIGRKQLVLKN